MYLSAIVLKFFRKDLFLWFVIRMIFISSTKGHRDSNCDHFIEVLSIRHPSSWNSYQFDTALHAQHNVELVQCNSSLEKSTVPAFGQWGGSQNCHNTINERKKNVVFIALNQCVSFTVISGTFDYKCTRYTYYEILVKEKMEWTDIESVHSYSLFIFTIYFKYLFILSLLFKSFLFWT